MKGPENVFDKKLSRRAAMQLMALAGAGAVLEACAPAAAPTAASPVAPAAQPTAPPVAAAGAKTLRVALQGDAVSLDTVQTNDTATLIAISAFADHLVRPVPLGAELALSYERQAPDVWLFKLRPDVKFHNGESFTADAVKFTLERYLDPEEMAPNITFIAGNIKEMKVIDPLTIEITTKTPVFAFPADMTDLLVQPPKYFEEVGGREGFAENPIGTGAYKFQRWVRGERIEYTRNDEWWDGTPYFENLVIRPIPDANTRVSALLANEIDFINAVPFERIKDIEGSPNHKVLTMPNERSIYCGMDTLNPPFNDKRVRQAMNYAVNWDAIVEQIFNNQVIRVTGGFSPVMLGDDPSITPYEYNLDKAKQLMQDAGMESGFDTYIVVAPGIEGAANLQDVAQAMISDWAKINVRVDIELTDAAGFATRYHGTRQPGGGAIKSGMYYFTHSGIQPGGRHLGPLFKSDTRGYYYQSAEADRLIDAYYASGDDEELKKNGSALKAFLKDDAPWVFMYQQPLVFGAAQSIQWQPDYGYFIHFGKITGS
jgi:peptide/nickel transport system substrate-binding protein